MKQLLVLVFLSQLIGCSSALLVANSTHRTTDEKIKEISEMDDKEINDMWSSYRNKCWTALDCAVKRRDYKLTEYLLKRGASPSLIGGDDLFPIQRAAKDKKLSKEDRYKFLKLLLDHKALPNICTKRNDSPLNYAIINNDYNAVELLLKNGAAVSKNIKCRYSDYKPDTPLQRAILSGKEDKIGYNIIRLLIFYNANVLDIEDKYTPYYTAAGYAESYRRKKKAKIIDQYAAKFTRRYPNYYKQRKEIDAKRSKYIKARIKRDKEEKKRREAARKRRQKYERQKRQTEVIDDSNTWVNPLMNTLKNVSKPKPKRKYYPSKTRTSPKTSSSPSSSSSKGSWYWKCANKSICGSKMIGRTATHVHNMRVSGRGSTGDKACQKTRHTLSYFAPYCNKKYTDGKSRTAVGAELSACVCKPGAECEASVRIFCD